MTALVSPAEGSLMSDFPPGLIVFLILLGLIPAVIAANKGPEFSCCSGCSAQSRRHGGSAMRSSWARKSGVPPAAKVSGVTRQICRYCGTRVQPPLVRAPGLPRA